MLSAASNSLRISSHRIYNRDQSLLTINKIKAYNCLKVDPGLAFVHFHRFKCGESSKCPSNIILFIFLTETTHLFQNTCNKFFFWNSPDFSRLLLIEDGKLCLLIMSVKMSKSMDLKIKSHSFTSVSIRKKW